MKQDDRALHRYIKNTKKYLLISRQNKRIIIVGFLQEVKEFSITTGKCTYEDLVENFGKPCDVAYELIENAGLAENFKKTRFGRLLIRGFLIVLFLLLIGLTCELFSVLSNQEVSVTETIYDDGEKIVSQDGIQYNGR